jgi:hypothetical protein
MEIDFGGSRSSATVSSRVGVVVLVKHLSATGADAVKRPKPDDDWFTNNLLPDWTKDECNRRFT